MKLDYSPRFSYGTGANKRRELQRIKYVFDLLLLGLIPFLIGIRRWSTIMIVETAALGVLARTSIRSTQSSCHQPLILQYL